MSDQGQNNQNNGDKKDNQQPTTLKLQIRGGQANPAPPLGPILGQNGIDIQGFCKEFNDKSSDKMGEMLPVVVTIFPDRTFKMVIKQPTVASMIKKTINLAKGSAEPNKEKVGKITKDQIREVAEMKMADLNTNNMDSAMEIVAGTAKSMGLEVE